MPALEIITTFLSHELDIGAWPDDGSLNGLQYQGRPDVSSVATTVDASLETISRAAAARADLLLAHHGLIWGRPLPFVDAQKTLIKTLVETDISVYAAHLPLDGHPRWGNNALVSQILRLSGIEPCLPYGGRDIAFISKNEGRLSLEEMRDTLFECLGRSYPPLSLAFGPSVPETVLVVTGAGADALYEQRKLRFDTLVTGEPRQFAYHFAKENKLNVLFAGHYATETVGVRKLGEVLAERFGVKTLFVDSPTGI